MQASMVDSIEEAINNLQMDLRDYAITTLKAQVAALTRQLQIRTLPVKAFHSPVQIRCDFCQGSHHNEECQVGYLFHHPQPEQTQYVGNFYGQQNDLYSNMYTQEWQNHPNFSWRNNHHMRPPPPELPQQEKRSNLEDALIRMANNTEQFMMETRTNFQNQCELPQQEERSNLEDALIRLANNTEQFMTETRVNFQNQGAQIRNLEEQIGQLANLITMHPQDNLPNLAKVNPRQQCEATILSNDKELDVPAVAGKRFWESEDEKRVDEEEVAFQVFKEIKHPRANGMGFQVETIDAIALQSGEHVKDLSEESKVKSPPNKKIVHWLASEEVEEVWSDGGVEFKYPHIGSFRFKRKRVKPSNDDGGGYEQKIFHFYPP